jgi:hypothetical protein
MNQTEIDEAVKLIAELDGKRTQGDWQKLAEWAVEGKIRTICDKVNDSAYIAAAPLMARTVAAQAEKIKRLEAANQWQDISTAPRNGRSVLVFDSYLPSTEDGRIQQGDDGYGVVVASFDKGFWVIHRRRGQIILCVNPTHWMPLPTPPNAAMKE